MIIVLPEVYYSPQKNVGLEHAGYEVLIRSSGKN
jgi:hypothetical protein